MEASTKRRNADGDVGLGVCSEHSIEPRTRAWDRPRQFRQNGRDSEPTANAGQQLGREDADG
jgi:hypothetical protein